MNKTGYAKSLKNKAKICLEGKYYVTVMTIVFFGMLFYASEDFSRFLILQINGLCKRYEIVVHLIPSLVIRNVVPYICNCFLNVMQIGLCYYFLKIVCNQRFGTFDLFYGFHHNFGKCFLFSILFTTCHELISLPVTVLAQLYYGKKLDSFNIDKNLLLIYFCAVQLILILILYPLSLIISQIFYIALDYPELSVKQTVKLSYRIMKGNMLRIIGLQVGFLPLYLLCYLSFGIASFWVNAYIMMTYTLFYLDIIKGRPASETTQ